MVNRVEITKSIWQHLWCGDCGGVMTHIDLDEIDGVIEALIQLKVDHLLNEVTPDGMH